jgi:NAD/NADP transhydrogenase alpha subunit
MIIGIPRETRVGETRVAATPETVKKLAASGKHEIVVEAGAGVASSVPDADYQAAGARIADTAAALGADIVLKVRGPAADELPARSVRRGRDRLVRAGRRQRLRARVAAANLPRAVDGRAVLAGQYRRLQGGDHRR